MDFTGAVADSVNLAEGKYGEVFYEQMKLFEDLMKVHKRGGFISCSISVSTESWILRVYFNENILEEIPSLGDRVCPSFACFEKLCLEKSSKFFLLQEPLNTITTACAATSLCV